MSGDWVMGPIGATVVCILWLAVGFQMTWAWVKSSRGDDRG